MSNVVMQVRCVHCGMDQYAPNVIDVSNGNCPCCWCGKMSSPMTEEEYSKAHRERSHFLEMRIQKYVWNTAVPPEDVDAEG